MRKIKRLALLLVSISLFRVDVAFSQASVSRSELRGQITDQNGAAVAGATITLTDAARGTNRTVQSDENGLYVFLSLPPGSYTMKVDAVGFAFFTMNRRQPRSTLFPYTTLTRNGVQPWTTVALGLP